ncbi:single-stranded DNA-binding protein [Actinoplanes sp. NPDC020271]|uniref:single-stranded DNA-binding protein n=1 Tax=Actinoplanes sp. NPDC020271 TaxID=3363896 RepID=UPI00379E0D94
MAGETTITVVGNLTGDPELRFLQDGTALAKFSIASTPRTLDRQSGQWKDGEPLFLSCTVWREMAENVAGSLVRGTRVVVQGRLKLSKWETPEGEKRSQHVLDIDEIGPSLKFAQAKVIRATRSKGGDASSSAPAAGDAWATPPSKDEEEVPF